MALPFVFQSINFPTMNLKIYRLKIFKLRIQLFKYQPRRDKSPRKKISVWNDLTEPLCRVLLSRFFAQPRADIRSIRDGIKSDQPARIRGWLYRNWGREEERKIKLESRDSHFSSLLRREFLCYTTIFLNSFFRVDPIVFFLFYVNWRIFDDSPREFRRFFLSFQPDQTKIQIPREILTSSRNFSWISSRCYPIFVGIWRLYCMNELLLKEGKNSKKIKTASQSLSQWIIQSRRKN